MRVVSSSWIFQSALRAGSSHDFAQQANATTVGRCMSTTQAITSLKISSIARARCGIVVVVLAEACSDGPVKPAGDFGLPIQSGASGGSRPAAISVLWHVRATSGGATVAANGVTTGFPRSALVAACLCLRPASTHHSAVDLMLPLVTHLNAVPMVYLYVQEDIYTRKCEVRARRNGVKPVGCPSSGAVATTAIRPGSWLSSTPLPHTGPLNGSNVVPFLRATHPFQPSLVTDNVSGPHISSYASLQATRPSAPPIPTH